MRRNNHGSVDIRVNALISTKYFYTLQKHEVFIKYARLRLPDFYFFDLILPTF